MIRPTVVLGTLLFSTFVLNGSPFANGNFETGTGACITATSFITLNSGTNCISNWSVSLGSIEYIHNYWQADDGTHSLDLNGAVRGAVQQTFDTVANSRYQVSFGMASNIDGGPVIKSLTVSAAGQFQIFTFNGTGKTHANMGWVTDNFFFIANSASTTLSFTSNVLLGGFGPALDAVSVAAAPIPEPASAGLLAAGVAFLMLGRRSLRRLLS